MMYKCGSKYVSNLCGSENIVPQQVDKMLIQLVKDHLVLSHYKRPGEKKEKTHHQTTYMKYIYNKQYHTESVEFI